MSVQGQFEQFNQAIYISRQDEGYQTTKEKDFSILEAIKKAFSDAGYPVVDNFMQGSFAKYVTTAIKNPSQDYDIDRAIVIDAAKAPSDPLAPKRLIVQVLKSRGFSDVKIKKPCVTADYKSRNRHIDYVVYTRDVNKQYKLAAGKTDNNKEWSNADPKGLIAWITDLPTGQQRDQFRRLVRYLKHWRNETFSPSIADKVFSIGLTVMAKEQFRHHDKSDLSALIDTVSGMLQYERYFKQDHNSSQFRVYVPLPKHPGRDIFNHKGFTGSDLTTGTQFRNQLDQLLANLEKAAKQPNDIEACKVLKTIFGSAFTGMAAASAAFPAAGAMGTTQGA